MLNFGTSAYLKLLALKPKARDRELKKRLMPDGGGYDFHKAMRRIAVGYASGKYTKNELQSKIANITRDAERNAAAIAVPRFYEWLGGRPIHALDDAELRAESPSGHFSVKFSPDFEIEHGGKSIHVHLWNTANPKIDERDVIGTMGLFAQQNIFYSLGILSLQSLDFFVINDIKSSQTISALIASQIENRIDVLREGIDRRGYDDRSHISPII